MTTQERRDVAKYVQESLFPYLAGERPWGHDGYGLCGSEAGPPCAVQARIKPYTERFNPEAPRMIILYPDVLIHSVGRALSEDDWTYIMVLHDGLVRIVQNRKGVNRQELDQAANELDARWGTYMVEALKCFMAMHAVLDVRDLDEVSRHTAGAINKIREAWGKNEVPCYT